MGNYKTEGTINWLPLALFGASFMRPVLEDFGFNLDEGLVLVADNEKEAKRFVSLCMKNMDNCCKVISWNRRNKKPYNHCFAIMLLEQTHKEMEVIRFLSESDFLPIIVVGGAMPEYLRQRMYLFRIGKQDIDTMENDFGAKKIAEFKNYIISKISVICCDLENLPTTIGWEEYDGPTEMRGIYAVFLAIGISYKKYLRTMQSERYVNDFFHSYLQESLERIKLIPDFSSGEELAEGLSEAIWTYLSEKDIVLVDVENIEGRAWQLYSACKVILYDSKFYYLPTKMFREICWPFLQTISEPELKKQLKENNILYANTLDYTVKKQITTVFGNTERPRMIWLFKERVFSHENILLEDMFGLENDYVEGEMKDEY